MAPYDEGVTARPRDVKIEEAKQLLARFFEQETDDVFYQRQLEIIHEELFFHWITMKALRELAAEQRVRTEVVTLQNKTPVRFYWSTKNRYYARKQTEVRKLIEEHARINQATGNHGETMFDAALPREGFVPTAYNTREYKGRIWAQTEHNLDRIFERDGIAYGTEIKNTMDYIDQEELSVKLDICDHFGLRPLLIMRFAPKTYVYDIASAEDSRCYSSGSCFHTGSRRWRNGSGLGCGFQSIASPDRGWHHSPIPQMA